VKFENGLIVVIGAGIATFFTYLFGAFDPVLQLLVFVIIFDFFTGTLNAVITRSYSHRKAVIGILTKFLYLMLVALGARVDATDLYAEPVARTAIAWGVIIIELGSITNNFNKLGIPVPGFLLKMVAAVQKRNTKGNDAKGEKE